jgi:hypothetical protein
MDLNEEPTGPLKEMKSRSRDVSKRYCKRKRGNPGACPGDCMQCIMEFMMFPGAEEM